MYCNPSEVRKYCLENLPSCRDPMMNSAEKIIPRETAVAPEIDLRFMARILAFVWANKLIFAACILVGIVAAAVWMRVATPMYQAEMTLLPNPNETPSTTSKTSGIGNLLDLGLGGSESPNFVKFVDTLRSYRLAERLEERHQYLQRLYPQLWNSAERKWVPKRSITTVIRWLLLGREAKVPNITSLQEFIKTYMTVDEDKKSHSLVIKLRSTNPALAVGLLRDVQEEADGLLREDSRNYTQHAVDYLESALRGIIVEDHRRALTSLLIDYERTLILVSDTNEAFASIVVDPATLASMPVSPKPLLVYAGSLVVSVLAAFGIAALSARPGRMRKK
jgi:hypothetical protein